MRNEYRYCNFRLRGRVTMLRPCPRCGMRGQHVTPQYCIDALRDAVAGLQFRVEQAAKKPAAPRKPRTGGYRDRQDLRMVVLDGEHLNLTEAARRLGLTAGALHWRIVHRTGTQKCGEVDLRPIGSDVPKGGSAQLPVPATGPREITCVFTPSACLSRHRKLRDNRCTQPGTSTLPLHACIGRPKVALVGHPIF